MGAGVCTGGWECWDGYRASMETGIGAHLLNPAPHFSPWQVLEEQMVSVGRWDVGVLQSPRTWPEKFASTSSLPLQSPALPLGVSSLPATHPHGPHPQLPAPPWTSEPLLSFVPAQGTDRARGGGAPAPRSLLDPADGLDLARLRVGPPLPHVLVLARGAVALQEVLEAPVARVLRADPPATEQRAAVTGAAGTAEPPQLPQHPQPHSHQSILSPAATASSAL